MTGTCRAFDIALLRPFPCVLAAVASATLIGAIGRPVLVEVHVSNGLPGFAIVGLPDAAVREERDRVRAAILSSGLSWPLRRVTINLAPASVQSGNHGTT
jgi:magnesium chelatase family protein